MSEKLYKEISDMPEYKELIQRRRKVTVPLVLIMLIAYYTFVFLVAYNPQLLSAKLADGVTSLGILLGLGIILLTFTITGYFVWYANSKIESLVMTIQKKAGTHE